MENNPNPTPAPEPTPQPETAPTPTPEQTQPTEAPAPAPDAEPEAPAVNPFNPATPAEKLAAPAAAPKKKMSGGVIAAIIIGAVILLGGLGFLLFSMFGKNPSDLANTAFQNIFNEKTLAYKTAAEGTSNEQTIAYSAEMVVLENSEAYFRIEGFGQLFGALFSAFGGNVKLDSESLETAFKEIEATWWKVEPGEKTSDLGFDVDTNGLSFTDRQKVVAALKANPFLVAEKVAQKGYSTSGDTYKITIDKDKFSAYQKAVEDNKNSSIISGLDFDAELESPFYFTITTPLFGSPILTGIYMEKTSGSSTTKMAIDFEHTQKTAPTEFKNASEMATILQGAISGLVPSDGSDGADNGNDDKALLTQRDIARRNDYAALATNITSYMANNRGQLPSVGILDAKKYLNETGVDPSGYPYHLEVVDYAGDYEMGWGVNPGDDTNVYVVLHATCDADGELADSEAARDYAIAGSLESGNYYCLSSR